MELKVWVEGIQRIVCGVTDKTTCQDVVYALAHATGKTGRFTLIERWRNNERLLAPHEHPLKVLMKWGEYSNDVQFILQRSALDPKATNGPAQPKPGGPQRVEPLGRPPAAQEGSRNASHPHKDLKKSLTFSGGHSEARKQEIGVPVRSMPPNAPSGLPVGQGAPQGHTSPTHLSPVHSLSTYSPSHPHQYPPPPPPPSNMGPSIMVGSQGPPGYRDMGGYRDSPARGREETSGDSRHERTMSPRRMAPPPYDLVRGNPPPPPPVPGSGVENVRATASHYPNSVQDPARQNYPLHAGKVNVNSNESMYGYARRDSSHDPNARPEPPYGDGRRVVTPSQGSHIGPPPGPPPSSQPPPYRNPPQPHNYSQPPPKPPHASHPGLPRELPPPYRNPPPPTSSPIKVPPSHGSPKKTQAHMNAYPSNVPHQGRPVPPPAYSPPGSQPPPLVSPVSVSPSPMVPPVHSPQDTTKLPSSPSHRQPPPSSHHSQNPPTPSSPLSSNAGNNRVNIQANSQHTPVSPSKEYGGESLQSRSPTKGIGLPVGPPPTIVNNSPSVDVSPRRGASEEPFRPKDVLNKTPERLNASFDSVTTGGHPNNSIKSPITRRNLFKDKSHDSGNGSSNNTNAKLEQVVMDNRYRELVRHINLQREKLNNQQVEMTKYEAEILYLEGRSREDENRLAYVEGEAEKLEEVAQAAEEEMQRLQHIENEAAEAKEAEDKINAELAGLRAKLSNCENELTICQEKLKQLEDDISTEKNKSQEEMKAQEEAILREIEKLQTAISQASKQAEHAQQTSQQLSQEMSELEDSIVEKKKEVETLVQEMKDANLQSLSITPSEEIRTLLEGKQESPKSNRRAEAVVRHERGAGGAEKQGPTKPGSTRRMIGSPRQLENAVPTSKNPHGVWV
ncbi:ras association domain-containing protein 8 isoform X2 [Oratosquilla oratoria]|uniref:ras association domain-containing protein 8 isoform X2 n=1 Tax=Oratosquilla oratoria TaxID=337810 RepID=UPI003F76E136